MDELLTSLGLTLDDMKAGLAAAATQLGEASTSAANDAARIGQEAMEKSFSAFVERFNGAGTPLVASMTDAGNSISVSDDCLSSAQIPICDKAPALALAIGIASLRERVCKYCCFYYVVV